MKIIFEKEDVQAILIKQVSATYPDKNVTAEQKFSGEVEVEIKDKEPGQ